MSISLLLQALGKAASGLALLGLLLFLPAGTPAYGNGWLLLGLLFIPMFLLGTILFAKAPDLLRKRLRADEQDPAQRRVVGFSALLFIVGFIAAGLDFRFGWTSVPRWLTILSSVLFLFSYGLYAEVIRENAWLSRTVEIQEGQTLIDTGLYGIVRHPMYAATILMFLSMPLILGSFVSLVVFLAYPVPLIFRIRNEEELLAANLPGYAAYQQRVKYRLFPGIW